MTMSPLDEINELLFRLLDNEISDKGLITLKEWMNSDPQAKSYYCRFMEDYSALALRGSTAIVDPRQDNMSHNTLDDSLWSLLSQEEKNAPATECFVDDPEPQRPLIRKVTRAHTVRTINKTSLTLAILSTAALVALIIYVYVAPPKPYEVATVCDSISAQWSCDMPIKPGIRISSFSKPVQLTGGLLKMITDDNVEIVIQSPAQFQFRSYSEIALDYGKMFVKVSQQGYGFSVTTPNSKIVDLGTEFSVLCHIDGNTEVHMYKGRANVFAGPKNASKTSQLLSAGSGLKVHSADSAVEQIALEKNIIVRDIDSAAGMIWKGQSISLADLVGGGNGFGEGTLNQGVDVVTGRMADHLAAEETVSGRQGYRPAADNPFVDGVFVPGVGPGPALIASDPSITAQFPQTSGLVWGYIFNGAFHRGMTTPMHSLELNGAAYGTPERPALTVHSNQGITFDLTKIRKAIPGLSIRSFRSLAGISQTVTESLEKDKNRTFEDSPEVKKVFDAKRSKVEFWVFIDGRQVFHQEMSSLDQPAALNIPIEVSSRFLTLAVTESDDTTAYDWALFGQPELVLDSE